MTQNEKARPGDLADFIAESLTQIVQGIAAAQIAVDDYGAQVNPVGELPLATSTTRIQTAERTQAYMQQVDFDIAVTRSSGQSGDAGAGIRVMGIGIGGSMANTDQHTSVSQDQVLGSDSFSRRSES